MPAYKAYAAVESRSILSRLLSFSQKISSWPTARFQQNEHDSDGTKFFSVLTFLSCSFCLLLREHTLTTFFFLFLSYLHCLVFQLLRGIIWGENRQLILD